MELIYKVVYYTMAGIRSKAFEHVEDAEAFCARHQKKYPEYQNAAWSRTEIFELVKREA